MPPDTLRGESEHPSTTDSTPGEMPDSPYLSTSPQADQQLTHDDDEPAPSEPSSGSDADPSPEPILRLDPALHLAQSRLKLGDILNGRQRYNNPESPPAYFCVFPSKLGPYPHPGPRLTLRILARPSRHTLKAHTPTAPQTCRYENRLAVRGYRWNGEFRATADEVVRAGYHDGDGHMAAALAILRGKRSMDWALDIEDIRAFVRDESYWDKVEDVLMGETSALAHAFGGKWIDDELTAAEEDTVPDSVATQDDGSDEEQDESVRRDDVDKESERAESSDGDPVEGLEEGETSGVEEERERDLQARLDRALEQRRRIYTWLRASMRPSI